MKKLAALAVSAIMLTAMIPSTIFAKTDNYINKVVTTTKDTILTEDNAPTLTITNEKGELSKGEQFELVLEGAKWQISNKNAYKFDDSFKDDDGFLKVGAQASTSKADIILLDESTLSVTLTFNIAKDEDIIFPLTTKVMDEAATVTIDNGESAVTAGTYKFARTTDSEATVKVEGKVDIGENSEKAIKSIIITESVAGALKDDEIIKIRLYGDFNFTSHTPIVTSTTKSVTAHIESIEKDEIQLRVDRTDEKVAGKIVISEVTIEDNKANIGDTAEIVISGAGVEKKSFDVGTLIAYGIKFTVEDKKLPIFYSGRKYENDDTLKVTFKETVKDSWWESRKTTLTFPEGIKVVDVTFGKDLTNTTKYEIDKNVVTIKGLTDKDVSAKAEWTAKFNLSISPDFVGDITCTISGAAVPEDVTVTVAEAVKPVIFEVINKDVSIDYRNVVVGDIIIKEAYAGALEEGKEIKFNLDSIKFEKGTKVEIIDSDIQFEDLDESGRNDGELALIIKRESHKTPATIKLTNVQVYLDRTLPAGSYSLKVSGDALIENDANKADIKDVEQKYNQKPTKESDIKVWGCFNKSEYIVSDKYINVITAGRDQDDSSFTTKLVVTIGATTMRAGDKEIPLDAPAYISENYTMMPVRALADALSGNSATVLWDENLKTVTIAFGARIISMQIGSTIMNINGVSIAMNKAPEITNNRTFIPLRDVAYAFGIGESNIKWDNSSSIINIY